jgi:hypothetical protein
VAFYLLISFLNRRKKRITNFLAGMVMPDVEFRYRQYKIDRRFQEVTAQVHLQDVEADPLD